MDVPKQEAIGDHRHISFPTGQPPVRPHNSRLDHSAPEVVPPGHLAPEKSPFATPPPSQQSNNPPRDVFWAQPEFEGVPPQYPGAVAGYTGALVAPPIEPGRNKEDRICGVRRGLFLLILAIGGLILLGVAVGVGVGVGLGSQNRNSGSGVTAAAGAG